MRNIIVTASLIFLIVAFALLKSVWYGFVFVALFLLMGLCLYWMFVLIINYIEEFKEDFDENFKMYCAQLINYENIEKDDIKSNEKFYRKKFSKTLVRDKAIEIIKMAIIATVFIVTCVSFVILVTK